nr:MAG TPA: hypothetical protein [Caudoviricetes sp.]
MHNASINIDKSIYQIPSGDVWIRLYVIIRNQKARFYGLFVYTRLYVCNSNYTRTVI